MMTKQMRVITKLLRDDGFTVDRVSSCKHWKVHLSRDGVRFFITVSKSPDSDATHRIRADARREFRDRVASKNPLPIDSVPVT